MKKVAVYSRVPKVKDIETIKSLIKTLKNNQLQYAVHGNLKQLESENIFRSHKDLIKYAPDYVLTLGGDGTLLDTVTLIRNSNIPVLGINTGKLGFLANIAREDIEKSLNQIKDNKFFLEKRSLLCLESNIEGLFEGNNFALNDFTIHKKDTSSMIKIHTYIDGEFLNSYWADGIVVATSTGSTAYSLSCGGPIIFPSSNSFVISPVAPHNLNVRPVVVPETSVISFKIEEDMGKKFLCTLDSRFKTIDSSYELLVKKANFSFNLIKLPDTSFSQTLRNKLVWGLDKRN